MTTIKIHLNGNALQVNPNTTLTDFLNQLDLQNVKYAVELNQVICVKSQHHNTILSPNDNIEVITAVGGG